FCILILSILASHPFSHTNASSDSSGISPSIEWKIMTGGEFSYSLPTFGLDGAIYIGGESSNLYAIDQNGSLDWTFRMSPTGVSAPLVGPDGTVYVASSDTNLYAINPNGGLRWKVELTNSIPSSPSLDEKN